MKHALEFLHWILPSPNRRHLKRAHAPFLLRYRVEEKGVKHTTNLHDLSGGGVLFTAEEPVLKGSYLKLEIGLPTKEEPVAVLAKVIRVSKIRGTDVYRIATQFTNINADDRKAIRVLIERMARDKRARGLVNRKKRIWTSGHE